jgi:hypothetical protein
MEILSALVLYTTPEQLSGMLQGYWNATGRLQSREPSDRETPSGKPPGDGSDESRA